MLTSWSGYLFACFCVIRHQLEEKVGLLLGELRTEEALMHRDELHDELQSLERALNKRRAELRDADRLLKEAREGAEQQEEKVRSKSVLGLIVQESKSIQVCNSNMCFVYFSIFLKI